jgi:hypothetical protein
VTKIVTTNDKYGRQTVGKTQSVLGKPAGMRKIGRDTGVRVRRGRSK